MALNKVTVASAVKAQGVEDIVKLVLNVAISGLLADFGYCHVINEQGGFEFMYKTPKTPFLPRIPRPFGTIAETVKSGEPKFLNHINKMVGVKAEAKRYIRSAVVIPMVYRRSNIGAIVICYKNVHNFTTEEKIFANFIANSSTQAIIINRLYRNLDNFKTTLDTTLDSVLMFDPETHRITYANVGSLKWFDTKASALKRKPIYELFPTSARKKLHSTIIQLKQSEKSATVMEVRFRSGKGARVEGEMFLQYIKNPERERRFIAIIRDISERKRAEREIHKSAYLDGLTRIPNRALFMRKLEEALDRSKSSKEEFAVMFIDLDRFKFINDILGHSAGDELLIAVATRLRRALKKGDLVARMGGDEFVVLVRFPSGLDPSITIAKRIHQSFELPFRLAGQEVYVNASIGISIYPRDGEDMHSLLKNSDTALYRAKEEGGTFQLYHRSTPIQLRQHNLALDSQLRKALRSDQFEVYFQPHVSIGSRRVVGYEALIRWNHPKLGLLTPDKFISQAEETGLITAMDAQVLAKALIHHKEFKKVARDKMMLSLNLSMRSLLKPGLTDQVKQALETAKVHPKEVKFELTETMVMRNVEFSMGVLQSLKNMGVRCLIDDFGMGYTSISYLKRLPVEIVKIDKSFVEGIGIDEQDEAIVSAIISLAHKMGYSVIAEGVQTEKQLDFLEEHWCEFAQGNLFSEPLPARLMHEWLQAKSLPI